MKDLLESKLIHDETPIKLENLSPEKHGKSAYCELTYTPSKLADNVIYKDVTVIRRIEESSEKLRENEALNDCLRDRVKQLE